MQLLKILQEYERAVIFRLGRLVPYRGPGIIYVIPLVERMVRVDLRTITMDTPPQDVITRDNVSVEVNAALIIELHPVALQLRSLQTLSEIATENNSTILFPLPIDVLRPFLDSLGGCHHPATRPIVQPRKAFPLH